MSCLGCISIFETRHREQIKSNRRVKNAGWFLAKKISPSSSFCSTMTDSYVSPNGYANAASPALQSGLSPVIRKKLMGYVGFANLPNQVHRKSVRKGFQFTAMVVGLFFSLLSSPRAHPSKANPASESLRSLTPSSTPLCTLPSSLCLPQPTAQRQSPLRASAQVPPVLYASRSPIHSRFQTSRRMVSVCT